LREESGCALLGIPRRCDIHAFDTARQRLHRIRPHGRRMRVGKERCRCNERKNAGRHRQHRHARTFVQRNQRRTERAGEQQRLQRSVGTLRKSEPVGRGEQRTACGYRPHAGIGTHGVNYCRHEEHEQVVLVEKRHHKREQRTRYAKTPDGIAR